MQNKDSTKFAVWGDSQTYCLLEEVEQMTHLSDDYCVLEVTEFHEDGTPVFPLNEYGQIALESIPFPFIGSHFDAELEDSGD